MKKKFHLLKSEGATRPDDPPGFNDVVFPPVPAFEAVFGDQDTGQDHFGTWTNQGGDL